MNVLTNAQANMDVTGVSQTPAVGKTAGVPKAESERLDLSKVLKPSEISKEDVEQMVEALKDLTETLQTKLNFSVDAGTNNIVVKIIDKDTDKVIRQIPPEEMLKLQEKMQDLTGFLLSDNI
ncbi:MAG: flagellar protein FlaG [Proteobacteria bacterium]|nr:flagellar protein FlaG [Pseudomonadota bacterium]MBU1581170.1 flagellar protein FlaG [Pseudomonadota bacterium]MBU2454587.1 flagellar protein FlaG [Pseudomonadota bacterium]MBU2628392.1 flagellar protein FlaG [Pseudomonadota bacterium]